MDNADLRKVARELRRGIVTATHAAKSGHPGGSLSATEIFTYLYFEEMRIDPAIRSSPSATALSSRRATALRVSIPPSPSGGTFPRRSSRPCAT